MKTLYINFLTAAILALFIIPVQAQEKNMEGIQETAHEMPRFPGCEKEGMSIDERKACSHGKLMDYIKSELQYPEEAQKQKVEGFTTVSFVVTKEGKITSPRIIKKLGAGCSEEALRVVNSMNDMGENWIPGKNAKGEAISVRYNLPIKFNL